MLSPQEPSREHDKLSCVQRGLLMWQDNVTVSCA